MNTDKYKLMSIILYLIKALLIFSIFKYIGKDKLSSSEAGMITLVIMFMIVICDLFYKSNVEEQKCECDETFIPSFNIPVSKPYEYEHFTPGEETISSELKKMLLTNPTPTPTSTTTFTSTPIPIPILTPSTEQPRMEQPRMEQPRMEQPRMEQPRMEQPRMEQPRMEQPRMEQPRMEQPRMEQPRMEQPRVEHPTHEIITQESNYLTDEYLDTGHIVYPEKISKPLVEININKNRITEEETEIKKINSSPLLFSKTKPIVTMEDNSEMESEYMQKSIRRKTKKPKKYMEEEMVSKQNNKQNFFSPYATVENNYIINDVESTDYNHLPIPDDYDTNLYEYGYSFLPPEKWYPQPPNPPVCVTSKRCSVCPSLSQGTPIDVKEWNTSRKITAPINIDSRNFD